MITIKRYGPLFHYIAETQYELCSSFLRIEEFYESPFDDIRGNYFTVDNFMDRYANANEKKEFTYFTDWSGFNVPGNSVLQFYDLFHTMGDIRPKEMAILSPLVEYIRSGYGDFYIIGTYDKATIAHERAHALYYLNSQYRNECAAVYRDIPEKSKLKINDILKDYGYTPGVYEDETQAYLATDSKTQAKKRFGSTKSLEPFAVRYQDIFNRYDPTLS